MANIFSRLFNSGKHDTTYTGTKPVASLESVGLGPEYKQAILDKLNRRNTGYGDNYVGYGNPQVENLRNTFNTSTLPELKSELTATGRRGGSAGFSQIEQAYRNEGLNENDIIGRLAQRQAEAQREDYNNGVNSAGNYAQNETNLINNRANFDYADNNRQISEANQRRTNESQGLQRAVTAAGSVALAPFTGGSSLLSPMANTSASNGSVNAYNPRNYIGYGQSGNSIADRLRQRNAMRGRIV